VFTIFERLLEHPHERIEVSLIVTGNVAGKPSGTLAVENHQLCETEILESQHETNLRFLRLQSG
jgi:hypothetical protein